MSTVMAVCFLVHDLSMSCDSQIVWVCDKAGCESQLDNRTYGGEVRLSHSELQVSVVHE